MKNSLCKNCNSPIVNYFSLGDIPLANSFLEREKIADEKKYDLSVGFCPECYLVQLANTVPPEDLFRNYIYFSSNSKFFSEHCQKTANYLAERLKLGTGSLVLEIASNDGIQLQYFKDLGIRILGVDPARNIAEVANKKGIPTLPEFFNHNFSKKLREERGLLADLVFGANVLAHVPEITDFTRGVKEILGPRGTAVFEFPYIKGLMEGKFDTIYHEHVFYYSLIALKNIFKKADLEIYDVETTPMQGGSLRIFITHPGNFSISDNVKNFISREIKEGYDKLETYQKINTDVNKLKLDIVALLDKLGEEGKKVAAYGAPAKGNILLNYFGIGNNYLKFVVDKAKEKQGLYTPGTHLSVHPLEKIYQDKPDYLLVLCWNIIDEVMEMRELQEYKKNGGKFIVPVPRVRVI